MVKVETPRTRIMVVEDEAIIARDISQSLRGLGYEVTGTAASSDEALELAAATHPSLAFMDIRIQGPVDGVETASRLAALFDIPIIFLTAHSDALTLNRAISVHPYGYLVKPPDDREIQTAVAVALSRHREDQQSRLMERALAGAGFGVLVVSASLPGTPITHCNPAFERMYGAPAREIVGRDPWFLDGEGPDSRARSLLSEAARLGAACRTDWLCIDREGRLFVADVALSTICDASGKPTHFVYCFSKVSAPDSRAGTATPA